MSFVPIDFGRLNAALLDRAERLMDEWLPGGKLRGREYVCGDLGGGAGDSMAVNLDSGRWADFAGDASGGDLVSLYAAIEGKTQIVAARELMDSLGMAHDNGTATQAQREPRAVRVATVAVGAEQGAVSPDPRPEPPLDVDGTGDSRADTRADNSSAGAPWEDGPGPRGKRRSMWRAVTPVPASAPPCDFWHFEYKVPDATWAYEFNGQLLGHVARFVSSTGGKVVLPYTWCVDESDDRGTMRWHGKQWDPPRPLYVPAALLSGTPELVPVVLVEGEKCAMAGHTLLPAEFDWVSWSGGCKAWDKADWSWLKGRVVYLWPDCDAKRKKPTRAELAEGVDPNSKPLLPEAMQPGMRAMIDIGTHLLAEQGCVVLMCRVPQPGAVGDGWDVADAIAQGWDAETVRAFVRGANTFVAPDDAARAKVASADVAESMRTLGSAGANLEWDALAWRGCLMQSAQGAIKAVRENVVLALDGLPEKKIPGCEQCAGVIAFNEFTNDVVKLKPSPWGTPAGLWEEVDDLLMGEWLTREHYLPSMPRGTLEEAVRMVAYRHRYHPVRAELQALQGQWDGVPRLSTWLRKTCMVDDEFDDEDVLQKYLARVGTWMLMGMCARVLTPGCKFDYMPIFEGAQGVGKSTLVSVLGGGYYADTGLVLGDKDSFQNLQGIWVYEWGELDSLNKSEVTKVKSFISSMSDRFRASFDRRSKSYPRQCIFVGTTNENHYLTDPTGNRRMWPVLVTRQIDLAWLRANREQLFAEALMCLERGDRFHPNAREQRELFELQQQGRTVENAIESAIARYLYDERQTLAPNGENGTLVNEVTLLSLLGKVGIGLEKLGPGRFHEKQAASALRRLGWIEARSSDVGRPRVYRRPPVQPEASGSLPSRQFSNGSAQIQATKDGTNDCPF